MQTKAVKDFGINREEWNTLLRNMYENQPNPLVDRIQDDLEEEYAAAQQLKPTVESEWKQHEKNVLTWLKELTNWDFKEPTVKVCVVPFPAGQTPFRNIPLIVVGNIRKGWRYPETIAHELAHILFNQNAMLESEIEHPYVQLIEEEIAVRLRARARYFDYEIPSFADWAHKAQKKEDSWKRYLKHTRDYRDIAEFIKENENTR